jgi:hypothetical protein
MADELLPTCPRYRGICRNPIFIIGSPRSGTTALALSLAQHSQLWTSDESDILFHLFGNQQAEKAFKEATETTANRWLKTQQVDRKEFLAFLGLGLNALFTSRSQGKRWVDQTPLYTEMADVLADLFPGAFFIHLLRDGRRVVNSMSAFLKSAAVQARDIKSDFIGSWSTDFKEACKTWRSYVENAMTFCARQPTRCLTVRNERLLQEPEEGFNAILQFVGCPYEAGPATFFKTHRINSSFQKNSVEPLSLHQFPNPWNCWSPEQKTVFLKEAGPTMVKYGLATEEEFGGQVGNLKQGRATHEESWDPEGVGYEEIVARIRRIVTAKLPVDCTVAVVSKGDPELLKLDGRKALHVPQNEYGDYAGYNPGNGAEAVGHLEMARGKGADYLLLPCTSFWWLDHYPEFRKHLESCYPEVWTDKSCKIYLLSPKSGRTKRGQTP